MDYQPGDYIECADVNFIRRQSEGFGIINGLSTSQAGASLAVIVGTGSAIAGLNSGALFSNSSPLTLSLTSNDTFPRKAIIYMDSAGSITVSLGSATSEIPSGNIGRQAKFPFAPLVPSGSTFISELWIPAGATVGTDVTAYDASKMSGLSVSFASGFNEDMISTYYPQNFIVSPMSFTASWQGDATLDTTTCVFGTASLKLFSSGGNLSTMTFVPDVPLDLQNGGVYVWVRPHGLNNLEQNGRYSASSTSAHRCEIIYSKFYFDSSTDNWFKVNLNIGFIPNYEYDEDYWHKIYISQKALAFTSVSHMADFTSTMSMDTTGNKDIHSVLPNKLANCTKIEFGIRATGSTGAYLNFNRLEWYENPLKKGIMTLYVDDWAGEGSYESCSKYNMRVCAATIGTPNAAQAQTASNYGWDIISHGYSHAYWYNMTRRSLISDSADSQDALKKVNCGDGWRFHAYPGNAYGKTTESIGDIRALNDHNRKWCLSRGSGYSKAFPLDNPDNCPNMTIDSYINGTNPFYTAQDWAEQTHKFGEWLGFAVHPAALATSMAQYNALLYFLHTASIKILCLSEIWDQLMPMFHDPLLNRASPFYQIEDKNSSLSQGWNGASERGILSRQLESDYCPYLNAQDETSWRASITGTGAIFTSTGPFTLSDFPRNLRMSCTSVGGPSGKVEVRGFNAQGEWQWETFSVASGSAVEGNIPWASISSVVVPATIPSGDTISIGRGNKIGLLYDNVATANIQLVKKNNTTTAAYTWSSQFRTIDVGTIADGDNIYVLYKASKKKII